jgi:hypothetical protein
MITIPAHPIAVDGSGNVFLATGDLAQGVVKIAAADFGTVAIGQTSTVISMRASASLSCRAMRP